MSAPDENGLSPLDLALKSQRLESLVVLLLAEYPFDRTQFRKIEDFIAIIEPRVMEAYARCHAKTEDRWVNEEGGRLLLVSFHQGFVCVIRCLVALPYGSE